ncbi:hypothetical protein LX36DRAFT_713287 [Colletotrichum falcatum]|nr:hypothetical protein LX36DRAFT_713287 [Colletotrichum falcatum]
MSNTQPPGALWAFEAIIDHHRDDAASTGHGADVFEMRILWNDGSATWEPEHMIQTDAPNTLVRYYGENNKAQAVRMTCDNDSGDAMVLMMKGYGKEKNRFARCVF